MKNKTSCFTFILITLLAFILGGCAGGSSVDENKPLTEVKADAEKMSVDDLKKMVTKVKEAIAAKQPEIEALTAKLKEIPLTEMLGEDAKKIKGDLENIQSSISSLQQHFEVYMSKLKEQGADAGSL